MYFTVHLKVIHPRYAFFKFCIKKTHSSTTHIQVFQVTSFGLVNKPTSDLLLYQELSSENLTYMHGQVSLDGS